MSMEEYKQALMDEPSERIREKLLAEADDRGFTALEMAELSRVSRELWA